MARCGRSRRFASAKAVIEGDGSLGLRWSVVESVPVHDDIKLGRGDLDRLYDNFCQTLRNLGVCGVRTVCYHFLLILDWTRTDLAVPQPGGGTALRMNMHELAAFDVLLLLRPGVQEDYTADVLARATDWFARAGDEAKAGLWANVIAGLPGAFKRYEPDELRAVIAEQSALTHEELRRNLVRFLEAVIPAAEEAGIMMAIHPDDPPRDLAFILDAVPSENSGLTLCTGSLGAAFENDVPAIARRFAGKIRFCHFRNVRKDPDGSLMESEHLAGDVDMVEVVSIVLDEEQRRRRTGGPQPLIPFWPDHGHELIDDVNRRTHPGYPVVGRLRGLAELRGVMAAVAHERGYTN